MEKISLKGFKPVYAFEERYLINKEGRVYDKVKKEFKNTFFNNGKLTVALWSDKKIGSLGYRGFGKRNWNRHIQTLVNRSFEKK